MFRWDVFGLLCGDLASRRHWCVLGVLEGIGGDSTVSFEVFVVVALSVFASVLLCLGIESS